MPRIQMTPMVKIALLLLRVYLIVMLGLIAFKFCRVFSGNGEKKPGTGGPANQAPAEKEPSARPLDEKSANEKTER